MKVVGYLSPQTLHAFDRVTGLGFFVGMTSDELVVRGPEDDEWIVTYVSNVVEANQQGIVVALCLLMRAEENGVH